MFSDCAGSNGRVLVTFSIFLDIFKLDLLDQHGRSKFQNQKIFLMADHCDPCQIGDEIDCSTGSGPQKSK